MGCREISRPLGGRGKSSVLQSTEEEEEKTFGFLDDRCYILRNTTQPERGGGLENKIQPAEEGKEGEEGAGEGGVLFFCVIFIILYIVPPPCSVRAVDWQCPGANGMAE